MKIPNLPIDKLIDSTTNDISSSWRQFFDFLIKQLQSNASNEGVVSPSQSASDILKIQNNQLQNLSYTCQYGTSIYNSTANSIMFAINNGANVPLFKTVTLV